MPHQHSQPAAGVASVAGKRPGFTLLELLIVVAIIGILAVVAVFSYVGVQRQATVDFAADTVVSALREAQDLARSGRRGTEDDASSGALCQAVKLVSGPSANGGGLFTAVSKYVAVDGELVDSCTALDGDAGWRRSEGLSGRLEIISAGAGPGASGSSGGASGGGAAQVFYFKPPFGKILGSDAGSGALQPLPAQVYVFIVGDPDNPQWNREVIFDTSTGEARKSMPVVGQ